MSHSIFVRDVDGHGQPARQRLAHAIQSASEARRLARRIAASYPESGANPVTRVFWFRDRTGLHEIWAARER